MHDLGQLDCIRIISTVWRRERASMQECARKSTTLKHRDHVAVFKGHGRFICEALESSWDVLTFEDQSRPTIHEHGVLGTMQVGEHG